MHLLPLLVLQTIQKHQKEMLLTCPHSNYQLFILFQREREGKKKPVMISCCHGETGRRFNRLKSGLVILVIIGSSAIVHLKLSGLVTIETINKVTNLHFLFYLRLVLLLGDYSALALV